MTGSSFLNFSNNHRKIAPFFDNTGYKRTNKYFFFKLNDNQRLTYVAQLPPTIFY